MKTNTSSETIVTSEDKSRKSLHELQPSAINKETLVGADRMINSTEQSKKAKPKRTISHATKNSSKHKNIKTKDKAVQTVQEEKVQIEAEDLISTDAAGPSKNYWQVIAEKRRVALKNALEENKELVQCIEKLEEEKRIYKEMLDETRTYAEVLQEMIGNDKNGINNLLEDSIGDDRNGINNSLEDSIL
ncbi:geminin [Camponotus floridanus]|uniref:geminin n=1 Tax=Camponotus floridanus TaxID=104421 RepID=UPI000DC67CD2|nr:geminin [Camponotus floridanus]